MGIIGGALGAVGSIFGGISRNRMLRKQMDMVRDQQAASHSYYDKEINKDWLQSAAAQSMLTRALEDARGRARAAAGTRAVTGGSEESVASAKAAELSGLSNATAGIAVAGESRADTLKNARHAEDLATAEELRKLEGQKAGVLDIANGALAGAAAGLGA